MEEPKYEGVNPENVVAHPKLRTLQLQGDGWKAIDRLVALIEQVDQDPGALRILESKLQSEGLESSIASVDQFALLLAKYAILFDDGPAAPPDNRSGSDISDAVREHADRIHAALIDLERRKKESRGFVRARLIADAVAALYQDRRDNPIEIIVEHLGLFFEGANQRSAGSKRAVSAKSSFVRVLHLIASRFAPTKSNSSRLKAIKYWLSEPFASPSKHQVAPSEVRTLAALGKPYRELMLDRLLAGVRGQEKLDPHVTCWADWGWVFDVQADRRHMRMAVTAAFQLCDSAEAWDGEEDDIREALVKFFQAVEATQLEDGGRSFWDLDTAQYCVTWMFYHPSIAIPFSVQVDFASEFGYFAAEEADEGAAPGLHLWQKLIERAVSIGYIKLAQALAAYVLLEEIGWRKGISDWATLLAIVRLLRAEPYFELFALAIQAAAEVLRAQGHELLALRLEPFVQPGAKVSRESIKYLIETVFSISKEEVEHRLIEHLTAEGWEKFSAETRTLLIEADHNWSHWRFDGRGKDNRVDWSPIALQFAKAIEYELTLRYEAACKAAGLPVPVTIGNVLKLMKRAVVGGEPVLEGEVVSRLTPDLVKRLLRFNQEFRNPSAHGSAEPFSEEMLNRMRRDLFQKHLLRDIAEQML